MMMKKMLMAYYKGVYLDDTDILIEVIKEDFGFSSSDEVENGKLEIKFRMGVSARDEEISSKIEKEINPFEIVFGDGEKGRGEDGKIYLKSTGMLQIYVACEDCSKTDSYDESECDKCDKIIYYDEETLNKIYNESYLKQFNKGNRDFAGQVLEYLNKCYSYSSSGTMAILMYSYQEIQEKTEGKWTYGEEDPVTITPRVKASPAKSQTIEYEKKVSEFATPVEFMVDLMEITGSKEFINAFIETVGNENYVKLKLYEVGNSSKKVTTDTLTRETIIKGENEYILSVYKHATDPAINNMDVEEIELNDDWTEINGITEFMDFEKNADGQDIQTKYKVTLSQSEIERGAYYLFNVTRNKDENTRIGKICVNPESAIEAEFTLFPNSGIWKQKCDVKEEENVESGTKQYDIAVSEAKTWYATYTANNKINMSLEIQNLQGTEDESEMKTIYKSGDIPDAIYKTDEVNSYVSYSDPPPKKYENTEKNKEIFNYEKTIILGRGYTENECLNMQFRHVITNGETSYALRASEVFKIKSMEYSDTNLKRTQVLEIWNAWLAEGMLNGNVRVQYGNIYEFLGLLSNDTGEYYLGASFKPQSNAASTGKLVEYNDLYGGKTKVGKLLENGSEMLYTLLESSEITRGFVDVMKFIMNEFANNNYSVENYDFYVFTNGNEWKVIK